MSIENDRRKTMQAKGSVRHVRVSGQHSIMVEGYLYEPHEDGSQQGLGDVQFPIPKEDARDWYVGREFVMTVEPK